MDDFKRAIEVIVEITKDYRLADGETPTEASVEAWVEQFDSDVQVAILEEMAHVLNETYISKQDTVNFLKDVLHSEKLAGNDPETFWSQTTFLDIQGAGASQKEMNALFDKLMLAEFGFGVDGSAAGSDVFIYLDDGTFTGNRVRRDLENWIKHTAPKSFTLHIINIALHNGGRYFSEGKIEEQAKTVSKDMKLTWWSAVELEDRKIYTNNSDVLRPVSLPDDDNVAAYVEKMKYPPHFRTVGGKSPKGIFSGEEGRNILEQEFLKAGVRIRDMCPHFGDTQRPLGHMTLDTLGFGSTLVTFRNCPNNAPLALWAGDPWKPLFPRSTNSDTSFRNFINMLAKEVS